MSVNRSRTKSSNDNDEALCGNLLIEKLSAMFLLAVLFTKIMFDKSNI